MLARWMRQLTGVHAQERRDQILCLDIRCTFSSSTILLRLQVSRYRAIAVQSTAYELLAKPNDLIARVDEHAGATGRVTLEESSEAADIVVARYL